MIRFKCHSCGKAYEVKDQHAGKATKCAKCGASLVIPNVIDATPPPVPAPAPQPAAQSPMQTVTPQVRVAVDQPQRTGKGGFFRAFGITSGFMAAVAVVIVGLPILACGGCLGLALIFGPSQEDLERMRVEREAREATLVEKVEGDTAVASDVKPTAKPSSPSMSKATYASVREGMTYDQVIAIVGPPAQELSSNEIGGFRTVMYQWDAGFMANANMTFQNGKLISKAQFGL